MAKEKWNGTPQEIERVKDLYKDYQVMPYISPERDLNDWLAQVELSSSKLVPKRNMLMLEEGLLPGHIIVLWRVQFGTYTTTTVISKYFEHMYGVNGKQAMAELIEKGMVVEERALDSLDHLTAPMLKKFLKDKGVAGLSKMTKRELEESIHANFTEEELAPYFDIRGYHLTELGEKVLANHPEVIEKHPKKKF
ncbi:hypothetical protein [Granulicatella seriolae]|uniref:Uncharacterized protein n=1 Tax=Granulicatella seriolae TaxID=2967226 RepID=A0ABT1WPY5_9LACT|nr:hypothetical protein [Granulicatella seriolae]